MRKGGRGRWRGRSAVGGGFDWAGPSLAVLAAVVGRGKGHAAGGVATGRYR